MKVKEFIHMLQQEDPEADICFASHCATYDSTVSISPERDENYVIISDRIVITID